MIFLLRVRVVALLLNSIVETFAPHSQKKKTVLRSFNIVTYYTILVFLSLLKLFSLYHLHSNILVTIINSSKFQQ